MIITLAIITVIYALLILAFGYYWREDEDAKSFSAGAEKTLVSVIVAFRNEEKNLSALIDSLLAQTYTKCEFVLVDDRTIFETSRESCIQYLAAFFCEFRV